MSTPSIDEALAHLKDTSFIIQRSDMKTLAEIADAAAVATIIGLLQEEDWKVRARAAEALGEIGDVSAVPMLIATLHDKRDYGAETHAHYVSDRAATALGKIRDPAGLAALRAMLNADDFADRMRAARALLAAGDESAIPALLTMLHKDDFSTRMSVIRILGEAGDARAVPGLIAIVNDCEIVPVREAAAEALLQIGDSDTLPLKILICSHLTPHDRLDLLSTLRHVRYKGGPTGNIVVRYTFPGHPHPL